jgi:hypothetical protein
MDLLLVFLLRKANFNGDGFQLHAARYWFFIIILIVMCLVFIYTLIMAWQTLLLASFCENAAVMK